MNKKDLILEIQAKTRIKQRVIASVIENLVEIVGDALKDEKTINLVGFGNLKMRKRNGRTGVNPSTKEPFAVPARLMPVMKFSPAFKQKVIKREE